MSEQDRSRSITFERPKLGTKGITMSETEKKERIKVRRFFAYGLLLVFLVLFLVIVAVFTWKL
jgi:hypothetical protein